MTGLLDFEFCAFDWNAMELAICLSKYAGKCTFFIINKEYFYLRFSLELRMIVVSGLRIRILRKKKKSQFLLS